MIKKEKTMICFEVLEILVDEIHFDEETQVIHIQHDE
jgi:hypothetical protein